MPTTHRRPRRLAPAALRGLGVLLVLLGVVAMHQLAGGTHTGMMAGTTHAAAAAAAVTQHARPDGREAAATRLPSTPGPPVVDEQATERDVAAHSGMPLCLAVLTGLALLALPAVTTAARSTPIGTPAAVRHGTSPPGRGPPRDLLAQLCVLRT